MLTADEALLKITGALTAREKSRIVRRYRRGNPDAGPVTVEAILGAHWLGYSFTDQREPFFEANPDLYANVPATFAALTACCLGWPLTRINVLRLLNRAGLVTTLGRADIAALADQQRERAEEVTGLSAIAYELGSAALGQALYDLARDEETLTAKLDRLAAAEALHEYPATP
jgi:hypothetical protein